MLEAGAGGILPNHVGIILDGNRRWAEAQGLPTFEGHRKGNERMRDIARYAMQRGIRYLSCFVFSTENWKRSAEEVKYLMDLFLWIATKEIATYHAEGFRIKFAGSKERLSKQLVQAIDKAERLTASNVGTTVVLCLNYGGKDEIVAAAQRALEIDANPTHLSVQSLNDAMYSPDVPELDLIIRTSGEQRLSGFQLWRSTYAELIFSKKLWPDFTDHDFNETLAEYALRQRRFGT